MEADLTPTATIPASPKVDPNPTQSAVHAAVSGKTSDYRTARRAERTGKPLPDVPVKAEAPAPAPVAVAEPEPEPETPPAAAVAPKPEDRQVSKRQQQINDYERRLAEQDQRMRALEARLAEVPAAPRSETAAAAPPEQGKEKFPSLAEWGQTHTEASLEDYLDARDEWRDTQRDTVAQTRAADQARATSNQERASRFTERLQAATETTPDWHEHVPPAVMAATPLSGCDRTAKGLIDPKTGQPATFANVVAEVVFDSPAPVALLRHLADTPAEAERIARLPPDRWEAELARLDGRVQGAASAAVPKAPAPAPTKVLTAAPPTSSVVGARAAEAADPKASAIKSHNTRAYRELRREERRAAMGR